MRVNCFEFQFKLRYFLKTKISDYFVLLNTNPLLNYRSKYLCLFDIDKKKLVEKLGQNLASDSDPALGFAMEMFFFFNV